MTMSNWIADLAAEWRDALAEVRALRAQLAEAQQAEARARKEARDLEATVHAALERVALFRKYTENFDAVVSRADRYEAALREVDNRLSRGLCDHVRTFIADTLNRGARKGTAEGVPGKRLCKMCINEQVSGYELPCCDCWDRANRPGFVAKGETR